MFSTTFQPARHVFPHDRFLDALILRFIPRSVHPNHITVLRMLLTPLVLFFILRERYGIGIPLFLVAALTDAVDGALARTRDQITEWGKVFDPIADKLLIGSVLVVLAIRWINFYVAMAVIGVEIIIVTVALFFHKFDKYGRLRGANMWGKIKMIFQVIAVFLVLLGLLIDFPALIQVASFVFGGAVVFALMSLFSRGM